MSLCSHEWSKWILVMNGEKRFMQLNLCNWSHIHMWTGFLGREFFCRVCFYLCWESLFFEIMYLLYIHTRMRAHTHTHIHIYPVICYLTSYLYIYIFPVIFDVKPSTLSLKRFIASCLNLVLKFHVCLKVWDWENLCTPLIN